MDTAEDKSGDRVIPILSGAITVSAGQVTPWISYSFAPEWFADLKAEAAQTGHHARRREILFAVCAAETYLFEWVRDVALHRDFGALERYFPAGAKRGVLEKFKEIPKALETDQRVSARLQCDGPEFQAFQRLVTNFRDGLVHASASHPDTANLREELRPVPRKDVLDDLPPGWAVAIVQTLLRKLHADTGTPQPDWL